jgi:transcriptional regulator with XRE-family HTH domain
MRGDFAKFVSRRRIARGIKGEDLAKRLDKKSPSYVSKLETDKSEVPEHEALKLIEVLCEDEVERWYYTTTYQLDEMVNRYDNLPAFSNERKLQRLAIHEQFVKLRAGPRAPVLQLYAPDPAQMVIFEPYGLPKGRLDVPKRPEDLSFVYDTGVWDYLVAWHMYNRDAGHKATLVASELAPVPDIHYSISERGQRQHVEIPRDIALSWYGPASAVFLRGNIMVASTGCGMVVCYDQYQVEDYVGYILKHAKRRRAKVAK